jgi:hypothetical protein
MTLLTVRRRLVHVSTAPGVGWCRLLTNGTAASEQTTSNVPSDDLAPRFAISNLIALFEQPRLIVLVARSLVDVVVTDGQPGQERFAIGVWADDEQGPSIGVGEAPGQ